MKIVPQKIKKSLIKKKKKEKVNFVEVGKLERCKDKPKGNQDV